MNIEKVINSLKSNGFTEYEAKIYLSLLKESPSNGNMIANSSGVPGPKVYESLRKMQEKGYIFLVASGEKKSSKRYTPLPYKDLLQSLEKDFSENLSLLDTTLEDISKKSRHDWTELFHIEGYTTSMDVVKSEIGNASSEVLISCWSEELGQLFPHLSLAHERGVKIVSLIFDKTQKKIPWRNFHHNDHLEEALTQRHSGELNIVIDQSKVIVFDANDKQPNAVVSSHKAMVATTRKYIRHDIYVNRIMNDMKEPLVELYGQKFEGLIDDF
ncbi:TrmB family transcriptional regulator [Rossellomorea arthrocnemi]|jgi:HTH-type transcriptional regulator, sugar sensing transcriptional regulator|uniref:TrmB family transcriptional regulator n=1 Tax=Rossellomorea arthrocnemi TaxID=2769542 RepID=UPI001918E948|nr:TrmB family transcriptional regulator [Rossellomorea arthrocnemi]